MNEQQKRRRRVSYGGGKPPEPPARQEELSVAETASYLGRSTEQVRRYIREGAIAAYRAGGQWFVPAHAAVEFRRSRMEGPVMEERRQVLKELRDLRAGLLKKYGYLDVSGWVAEAREGLR